LSYAIAIARAHNSELRALHVVPSEGAAAPTALDFLQRESLMQRLRESLAKADPAHDLIGGAVRQGDPGMQILRFARGFRADVIVMGAPGVDRPERPMGPVASVVVARSECPVLTVPAHPTARMSTGVFSRIVCAIDHSPSSTSVIRQALSLAWEAGGRLIYVCVAPEESSASLSQVRKAVLAAIPSEASQWCEMDVVVTNGEPSIEIMRIAGTRKADVVVIGAPRRWTSTTHAVLSHSLCPVLVTHDARPLPWPSVPQTDDLTAVVGGVNRSRS
jgi:nucleotide-binding universal stress UspA family protein